MQEKVDNEYTGIRLKRKTKARLDKVGIFGESHDDLIMRLLDFYEAHKGCMALIEGGGA